MLEQLPVSPSQRVKPQRLSITRGIGQPELAIEDGTTIGAAQKDTAREIGAKLASLKGIVWVGVVMFVFGIATLIYPPLRVIIGSVTTSVAIIVGGIALMILPTLVVGNELLILGAVALGVGGWFFAHRHGRLQGFVDANKDGVDDRLESLQPKVEG